MKKQDDKTSLEAPKEWRWYQMGAGSVHKAEVPVARWISIVISATAIGTTLGMLATVPNLPQFKSFAYTNPYTGFTDEVNINLTAPSDYSTVAGKEVIISVDAAAPGGIKEVKFYLDTTTFIQTDTTEPYSFNWDSTIVSDGPHNIFIKAYNSSGNWGYDVGYIVVKNTEDTIPPTISITRPVNESTVDGIITLEATAQDDRALHRVAFYPQEGSALKIFNNSLQQQLNTYGQPTTFSHSFDTRGAPNGQYTFSAKAYDGIDTFEVSKNSAFKSIMYETNQKVVWVLDNGYSPSNSGAVLKFDAVSGVLLKEIALVYTPGSMTYDSTQNAIWVNAYSDQYFPNLPYAGRVDKFDAATGNLIATYSAIGNRVLHDSANNVLWAQNYNQSTKKWELKKINPIDGSLITTYPIDCGGSMAYDSRQNNIWIASGSCIKRYSAATGALISSATGYQYAWDLEYDQTQNAMWMLDRSAMFNQLIKFDAATGIKIGGYSVDLPSSLIYDQKDNAIFADGFDATHVNRVVEKFNAATGDKFPYSIPAPSMAYLAYDPDQNMIWGVSNNIVQRFIASDQVNVASSAITININNTYPAIVITAPTNGSIVSGTQVPLSAEAFDDAGPVQQVDFYISAYDPDTILGSDSDYPYEQVWDSTMVANGTYALTAKVTDSEGNTAISDPITITVLNAPRIPPTAAMIAPEVNSSVKGVITVSADASDDAGIIKVEFYKDADSTPFATSSAPISGNLYSGELDTASMTDGDHMLYAVAYDDIGLTASANVIYTVVDNTPPIVSLVVPADGSTISGKTVLFSVNANDNAGIKQIDYYGSAYSPDTILGTYIISPYNMTWDSTIVSNGAYAFTAKATDVAGNTTISSPITLTVLNDATPPTTPGRPTENSNHSSTTLSSDQDYDSDGCYRVYWTKASDAESGIAAYSLQERLGTSGSWVIVPTTDPVALNYMKCGASQNTKYFYRVRAKNKAGLWSLWSSVSDGILVDKTAPSTVSVIDDGATTTNRTSFHVKWTASTDAESGISSYTYYLRKGSTLGTMVKQGSLSKTAIETTITGLTLMPGTTYYITIFAKNNAGISGSPKSSDGILVQ